MPEPVGFIKAAGFSENNWTGGPAAFVLTGFCNLRCPYCFAADLVLDAGRTPSWTEEQALSRLGGLREKTDLLIVSGGEPTLFRGLAGFLASARSLGFSLALETNGTQPHVLEHLAGQGLLDRVGLDLKARLADEPYSRSCGVDIPASLVRESLDVLRGIGDRVTLRTTIVKRFTGAQDVDALGPFLQGFSRWLIQEPASAKVLAPKLVKGGAKRPDLGDLVARAERYLPARLFRPEPYVVSAP
ncbi:MAG: radical SAM protein [Thermodesulfobacteriota bacterium]